MPSSSEYDDSQLIFWTTKSDQLLIKKLSRNDCLWAEGPKFGHQNGVYIPHEIREKGFFPELRNRNDNKPHIFESPVITFWPQTGEEKRSNLKHYSNKGSEMHFTRIPKVLFQGLTPASLIVGGRLKESIGEARYWFMTMDAASDEAELLESIFDLPVDFHVGLFNPAQVSALPSDETSSLIREIENHLGAGTLKDFIESVRQLPTPESLATQAQAAYLKESGLANLDPFEIANPGDAIMRISRDIEYKLYKKAELRHRAAEVIWIVTTGGTNLVESVVRGFAQLDAAFLSASQLRKSRAGRSFERHIARFLNDGKISFQEQAVTGGRRPDFVMPNLKVLNEKDRPFERALILSAKTTLRERWKQLAMERFNCELFLATVDDRISSDAIDEMLTQKICLVVPESLKNAKVKQKEICYAKKENVITFRDFFDSHIAERRPHLCGHSA